MLDVARHFEFQSTPPVKAATFCLEIRALTGAISIHAAREGGDGCPMAGRKRRTISIHAAREGGDYGVKA